MTYALELHRCTTCYAQFLAIDWLAWRVHGYCCATCDPSQTKPKAKQQSLLVDQ